MSCAEPRPLVQAYLDHELDVARSVEIEAHLAECRVCAAELAAGRRVREALAEGLYRPAPDALAAKIRARARRASSARAWRLPSLAVSLAAAALAAWIVIPSIAGRSVGPMDDLVAAHVRSLMVDHLTDVASTDRHTVKPWFEGKLDFSPMVVDLADHGFPLVGGRLEYVDGRAVAALVYGRQRHFVNLFVFPQAGADAAPRSVSRRGFHIVEWRRAGMSYAAVSDLNAADLADFAELFRQRAEP